MDFPRSLTTDEIALYVLGNFEWYRRKVAFAPRLLPTNYEELCPGFVLAEALKHARDDEVPELPQVVFLAILLNTTVKLGVLRGWMIMVMESAHKELQWRTFQAWVGCNRGRILEAADRRHPVTWKRRRAQGRTTKPPSLAMAARSKARLAMIVGTCILGVAHVLHAHSQRTTGSYVLSKAEEAACNFELPEMVQATFYAMLLNDVVELDIVSGFIAADLKASLEVREIATAIREREKENSIIFPNFLSTEQAAEYVRDNFHWSLRELSTLWPNLLHKNHHGHCPNFELLVTMRYAESSHTPEMIQAIFYAMVLNEVAELGLSSRIAMDCMMSALRELKWDVIESWL
ncbi:hypothetical protein Cgig2_017887 [Carnegiea gigantea]|uniref:Uncharacterized protein n=1 Tax=Carnegiea gigantea TaxID=171969 RepID=A0A9Q1JZT1_9CARY|nr:hypothetical protein Cgig2_017887 [Carnegiea gigantea]